MLKSRYKGYLSHQNLKKNERKTETRPDVLELIERKDDQFR